MLKAANLGLRLRFPIMVFLQTRHALGHGDASLRHVGVFWISVVSPGQFVATSAAPARIYSDPIPVKHVFRAVWGGVGKFLLEPVHARPSPMFPMGVTDHVHRSR